MNKIKHIASKLLMPCVCIILTVSGVFLGMNWNKLFHTSSTQEKAGNQNVDSSAVDWDGNHETYNGEKNDEQIQIPGYDVIRFKAGVLEQKVNIHNPDTNVCYFRLSLYLPDDTLIWQSELLEPGKAFYDIKLSQKLDAGNYENAHLKYECFSYDEKQTPLNGADIKLTIKVID